MAAGSIVGELALIDGAPRSATVRAVKACSLLRLDRKEFQYLRRNRRPAAIRVLRGLAITLAERQRATNAHIERLFSPAAPDAPEPEVSEPSLLGRLAFWRRS